MEPPEWITKRPRRDTFSERPEWMENFKMTAKKTWRFFPFLRKEQNAETNIEILFQEDGVN